MLTKEEINKRHQELVEAVNTLTYIMNNNLGSSVAPINSNDVARKIFDQAKAYVSLVEFIEGLETMLRPQDAYDRGFRNGQKETVDKLKTFIKENQ